MTKNIKICADDFGMSENINTAIIKLLEKKTINATSCMTNMPCFASGMQDLRKIYNEKIDIGIHLNLTEGSSIAETSSVAYRNEFLSLSKLLLKSKLRTIRYSDVYNELKFQINNFIETWGNLPDFIDGHQHIHHFPTIRDAVVKLYQEFDMYKNNTYIRSTCFMPRSDIKSEIIYRSGAKKFNKLLNKHNIKHNTSFAGVYDLESDKQDFREVLLKAYSHITDNGLIMCHPSAGLDDNDPISPARVNEYKYLRSEQAKTDQVDCQIKL